MIRIKIGQIREKRGLSYRQLEILSSVSKSTLRDIENGKANPTIETLEKIARGLKISIFELIEEMDLE